MNKRNKSMFGGFSIDFQGVFAIAIMGLLGVIIIGIIVSLIFIGGIAAGWWSP